MSDPDGKSPGPHLNEIMDDLLQELHTMANDRDCFNISSTKTAKKGKN
ncbi:MAG: hypothetical protein K1563_19995 [Candidatus Thiodiazotropha sp. (ex. Lucinisca nassula)]|nr:hypothetical protein [Candidatus Thiodiazotropha sp. (ex. Lucinisca nassula)]